MASDAVGTELLSRIVGYKLTKGDFSNVTPNLPMRIAILGEANNANQSSLVTDGTAITTAQRAGELYGYGSPIYQMMRILRPQSGGGVGGIPTIVFAQAEASGAVAKKSTITVTGTPTSGGTHTVEISGRTGVDGAFYDVNIVSTDTVSDVATKIETAVNAVIGSPVSASTAAGVVTLEAKWKGLTSDDLQVRVLTNNQPIGLTYAISSTVSGSATPSVQAALDLFGENWNTIVVNGYGAVTTVLDTLEAFNGIADPNTPTGRYSGIIFKPFIAITGSVDRNPQTLTSARRDNMTIAIAPAPRSYAWPFEAAANMTALFARTAQDNPHLGVGGRAYPDMPMSPDGIGDMGNYATRDSVMKLGCSTVSESAGKYIVEDFITTYRPIGEIPPQFRYCRNLNLDWNVRFGYYLLEQTNVVDHVIANDNDTVTASKVIKPKRWKSVLRTYAEGMASRGLIADPEFMVSSLIVNISTTNPDRLETFFRYKRTGLVRIASTTGEAGFNFGTNS
jgi:phage tail sheath gpL-like